MDEVSPYAFAGCEQLEYFEMPISVTHIGNYAFNGCYKLLSNVEQQYKDQMFAHVQFIGQSAFMQSGIKGTLRIGGSVIEIAIYAFAQCADITKIEFGSSSEISQLQVLVSNSFYACKPEEVWYYILKSDENRWEGYKNNKVYGFDNAVNIVYQPVSREA